MRATLPCPIVGDATPGVVKLALAGAHVTMVAKGDQAGKERAGTLSGTAELRGELGPFAILRFCEGA
jgi:hypothetical protein